MMCSGRLLVRSANKIAEEVMKKDMAEKPKVMTKQHKLLRERYDWIARPTRAFHDHAESRSP